MNPFPVRFPSEHADAIQHCLDRIRALQGVVRVIVYGSYAKGEQRPDSDIDVAVFFEDDNSLLERYRTLVGICSLPEVDIQVQAFDAAELKDPCGIVEEIVKYGVDFS